MWKGHRGREGRDSKGPLSKQSFVSGVTSSQGRSHVCCALCSPGEEKNALSMGAVQDLARVRVTLPLEEHCRSCVIISTPNPSEKLGAGLLASSSSPSQAVGRCGAVSRLCQVRTFAYSRWDAPLRSTEHAQHARLSSLCRARVGQRRGGCCRLGSGIRTHRARRLRLRAWPACPTSAPMYPLPHHALLFCLPTVLLTIQGPSCPGRPAPKRASLMLKPVLVSLLLGS